MKIHGLGKNGPYRNCPGTFSRWFNTFTSKITSLFDPSKHQRVSLQCSSQVAVALCTWYGAQLDIYLQAKAFNKSDSRFKYLKERSLCTVENQVNDIRTNMYNVVKRDAQSETCGSFSGLLDDMSDMSIRQYSTPRNVFCEKSRARSSWTFLC